MPGFSQRMPEPTTIGAGRRVAAASFRPRRSLCEEAPDSGRNIICSAARASDYAEYVQPAVNQRREQRRDHDSNNDPLSALTSLPGLCQRLLLRHCRHRQPRTRRKSPDFISRVVRSMALCSDAVTQRTRRMPRVPICMTCWRRRNAAASSGRVFSAARSREDLQSEEVNLVEPGSA